MASIDLQPLLAPYADRLPLARLTIAAGALDGLAGLLRVVLPSGRWLVVADPITYGMAGQRVEGVLRSAGVAVERLVLGTSAPTIPLVADEARVEEVRERIRTASPPLTAAVAVGAGTINDIVKMAAYRAGLPYAVVPTAPSMNGYTSPIAAILSNGVKTVQEARLPVGVVADVEVLARAPARMIAAGFGDLLSRPVSNADWWLSHHLTGSAYAGEVIRLAETGCRLVAGVAARLPQHDADAVARLTGALMLSGYAMTLAGSSAPASGGEHLISHYLDMTHYALGGPADLHGCQVGVGTRVTAAFYERLLRWDPRQLALEERLARHRPWPEYAAELCARFGRLAPAVLAYAREGYPEREVLRQRLETFCARWPEWRETLRPLLRTSMEIAGDLATAGCPRTFSELGVDAARARRAVLHSKDIRPRYTVLHLCWDLGVLEPWTEAVLPEAL